MKIKKGDEIKVLSGKDRGRRGKVERVFPKLGKILVPGLNIYKRHKKSRTKGGGEIVEVSRPIDVNKVAVWCGSCNKSVRVMYVEHEGGRRERICKKCKGVLGGK